MQVHHISNVSMQNQHEYKVKGDKMWSAVMIQPGDTAAVSDRVKRPAETQSRSQRCIRKLFSLYEVCATK